MKAFFAGDLLRCNAKSGGGGARIFPPRDARFPPHLMTQKEKSTICYFSFWTTVSTTYTLIGFDQFNCTDTLNSIITVFPQPIAGFIFDPAEGCDPVTVAFGDTSPYALNWIWSFSDGTNDSTQNPVHTFVGPGSYGVTLYVSGLGGCNDITIQNNIITVFPEPVADKRSVLLFEETDSMEASCISLRDLMFSFANMLPVEIFFIDIRQK